MRTRTRRWRELEKSAKLQEYSNYGIGAAYGLIALVAFVSWLGALGLA